MSPNAGAPEAERSIAVIRESAKWVLAAFAGIGAALVAGVQLGDLGNLGWEPRLALALAGLGTALTGVTWVIFRAERIVSVDFLTVREVNDRRVAAALAAPAGQQGYEVDDFVKALLRDWESIPLETGASGVDELARLQEQVQQALATLDRGEPVTWRAQSLVPKDRPELEAEVAAIRRDGQSVVEWANAWAARRAFQGFRRVIVRGGLATVLGLVAYSWAVSPPSEAVAAIDEPMPVTVSFTADASHHVEDASVRACVIDGGLVNAMAVAGDLRSPEVVLRPRGDCRGALLKIGPEVGVVIPHKE